MSRKRSESPTQESLAKRQKSSSSSGSNVSSSMKTPMNYRDRPNVLGSSPDSAPDRETGPIASSPTSDSLSDCTTVVAEESATVDLALTNLQMEDAFAIHGIEELPLAEPNPKPQLDTLPKKVLTKIFTLILQRRCICPGYTQGMLRWGSHSMMENDEGVSKAPNIDSRPLLINKILHKVAADALYGTNIFDLDESEKAWWWLKRIGDHNVARLRTLCLRLDSGWWYDHRAEAGADQSSPSDLSAEETWYKVVSRLHRHARLETIGVELVGWRDKPSAWTREALEVHNNLTRWRRMIVDRLIKFRGLKTVVISHLGPSWLTRGEVARLRLQMTQRNQDGGRTGGGSSEPVSVEPRFQVGLAELIENVKYDRVQRNWFVGSGR